MKFFDGRNDVGDLLSLLIMPSDYGKAWKIQGIPQNPVNNLQWSVRANPKLEPWKSKFKSLIEWLLSDSRK